MTCIREFGQALYQEHFANGTALLFFSCYKCPNGVTVLHLALLVPVCSYVPAPYVDTRLVSCLSCSLCYTLWYRGAVNTAYELGNHAVWINSCNLIILYGGRLWCLLCRNPTSIHLFPGLKFVETLPEIWLVPYLATACRESCCLSPIITDLELHDVTKYPDCKARSTRPSFLMLTHDVAQPAVSHVRKQLCAIQIEKKSLLGCPLCTFLFSVCVTSINRC